MTQPREKNLAAEELRLVARKAWMQAWGTANRLAFTKNSAEIATPEGIEHYFDVWWLEQGSQRPNWNRAEPRSLWKELAQWAKKFF